MKLKNLIHRVPRPVKVCICAILAVVLALSYYVMLGCPTLTLKQEFRRAERSHMVGPSEIVDTLEKNEYDEFAKLFVGETDEAIIFFGKYFTTSSQTGPLDDYAYRFVYLPKTGSITVAPAPNNLGHFWYFGGITLPVYVFTNHDNAARAVISFRVSGEYRDIVGNETIRYNESFTMETVRLYDGGPFRFIFHSLDGKDSYALGQFSTVLTDQLHSVRSDVELPIYVTIRLFDANDQLITEEIKSFGEP